MNIFLDDERTPSNVTWMKLTDSLKHYQVVRSYDEFVSAIKYTKYEVGVISFDHDLQDFDVDGNERTGYDCLKWLVEYCVDNNKPLPTCYFHTKNPVGKENMEAYYENAKSFLEQI